MPEEDMSGNDSGIVPVTFRPSIRGLFSRSKRRRQACQQRVTAQGLCKVVKHAADLR
jgi:hypothetical protein